jgi:hypothetical protein
LALLETPSAVAARGGPLQMINPPAFPGWDDLLLASGSRSFFHTAGWARVLAESYRYRPLYLARIDQGRLLSMLPVMEVKSLITGRRGVSLPFTDYCPPLAAEGSSFAELFEALIRHGKEAGWRYVELRDGIPAGQAGTASETYYGHLLDLEGREERLFANFSENTKRNIKKALREKVQVKVGDSLADVEEFYRLNCQTRQTHGLPPQPYHFFERIHRHILAKGNGIVVLASSNGRPIAGAVFFHFAAEAIYKYGASERQSQNLRGNHLVMWEAIRWYSRRGFRHLCFGRTSQNQDGLRRFKSEWGAEERGISYFRYDLEKNAFVGNGSRPSAEGVSGGCRSVC